MICWALCSWFKHLVIKFIINFLIKLMYYFFLPPFEFCCSVFKYKQSLCLINIYTYVIFYTSWNRTFISHRSELRATHEIIKTMCPTGYYLSGLIATFALGIHEVQFSKTVWNANFLLPIQLEKSSQFKPFSDQLNLWFSRNLKHNPIQVSNLARSIKYLNFEIW